MGIPLHTIGTLAHGAAAGGGCHGSGLRGWTGVLRELWDMNIMYETRTKDGVTTGAVRDVEEGAADDGIWGHYGPPKNWISLFYFVFLFVVSGQGRRSTRAWGG